MEVEIKTDEEIEMPEKKIPEEIEPKLPEEFPAPEDMPIEEPMGEETQS